MTDKYVYELGETFTGTHAQLKQFILAAYDEGIDVQMISHDTAQIITVWLADEPLDEPQAVQEPDPGPVVLLGVVEPPTPIAVKTVPVVAPKLEKSSPFVTKKKI